MLRTRGVAICAALITVSSHAAAQSTGAAPQPIRESGLTLRARSVHGYTHETRSGVPREDSWYGITPELSLLHLAPRGEARATYAVTGGLHSEFPDEIAHRGMFSGAFELSPRTNTTLAGEVNYSTITNFLVARPAFQTPLSAIPRSDRRLLSTIAAQGLSWEASPVVRVDEHVDGTYVVVYDGAGAEVAKNYVANAVLGVERTWTVDGLGVEARGGFASTTLPGSALDQRVITAMLAPRWRHEFSRSVSSLLTAGAVTIFSPEKDTDAAVSPTGRAALLYDFETAHVELIYAYGFQPNIVTGQLLRSHQATLSGTVPLVEREHIAAGATIGYLRGDFVDLRSDTVKPPSFDAVLADVELTWAPRPALQILARYQFLAQTSAADETLTRNAILGGVQVAWPAARREGGSSGASQTGERREGGAP